MCYEEFLNLDVAWARSCHIGGSTTGDGLRVWSRQIKSEGVGAILPSVKIDKLQQTYVVHFG
jgi:hypothetical protein